MHESREQTTTETTPATEAPRAAPGDLVVTFLGHATTLIDMDGTRLLTDPVLRTRVGVLLRHGPLPGADATEDLDAVLLSHFHLDHTDIVSLNMLSPETTVIAPVGVRALLRGKHFREIREMTPGDSVRLGSLQITATPAMHEGRRFPWNKPSEALGYSIQGSQKVYFAGDTGLFPELAELAGGSGLGSAAYLGVGTAPQGRPPLSRDRRESPGDAGTPNRDTHTLGHPTAHGGRAQSRALPSRPSPGVRPPRRRHWLLRSRSWYLEQASGLGSSGEAAPTIRGAGDGGGRTVD